ncbi:Dyp-type peroxidase family [Catalinimonas alkaloidigena]|uniref:Dyp-type peroxidase family n=1 Tax=Catalinimonas alkaloidigena TaxID=1075417 RepID=A0A1G9FBH2_9BACT|nr:Dyp-type peroxidase [Catalinimonas alkaloidigena]SDK85764.1 Dyp-type peroxidase family [Catalinimonas alkaloidigena]
MTLETDDIQGLLIRGYGRLDGACYVPMQFTEARRTQQWLHALLPLITPASQSPEDQAVHLALTAEGFRQLGIPAEAVATFSRQFKEGMTEAHRQFVLGDVAQNAPTHWQWGGPGREPHAVLMLFARDQAALEALLAEQKTQWEAAGIVALSRLDTHKLPNFREHFGFNDSISQPIIRGLSKAEETPAWNTLAPGEFILGYPNQYDLFPDTPHVALAADPDGVLPDVPPETPPRPPAKDLGRNGSYLVFRQMSQDVPAFWQYLKAHSQEPGATPEAAAIGLGAKMVGRWPSGAPLTKTPDQDDPALAQDNDFLYWNDDFHGLKCPGGAHIRRSNPRDWLLTERSAQDSQEMVQKHRLLRRGRTYGPPLAPSMDPLDLMQAAPDGQERGIHFICFVSDIVRQFEFVQNAWIRFHKFGGAYDDSDPLVGTHYQEEGVVTDSFTVPARPFRRRYKQLPQFTHMQGGAYFFLPGLRALRYLATFPLR